MVAYSFQRQFAEPIIAGTKGGTIRAERRNTQRDRPGGHARPGEMLQLFTAMRTKQCQRICDRRCIAVEPIVLNFVTDQALVGGLVIWEPSKLSIFARFDGFEEWNAMRTFWAGTQRFDGWHIRWLPLPEGIE